MSAKQITFILGCVVIIAFGVRYFSDATEVAEECAVNDRQTLPQCAEQQRIGSNVTVLNNCEYPISVHWVVNGGSDLMHDLEPGGDKQVSSYPLKINAVSCCSHTNRCF